MTERIKQAAPLLAILLIGFAGFLYHFRFSLHVLDIKNVGWLLGGGDKVGPFLGWLHFIHESWQWPLGHLSKPLYKIGNSLSLMDSLPLPSMILKALGAPLGVYQYHGYWFLFCYLAQAFFAFLVFSNFKNIKKNSYQAFAATAFVTFSPAILFRMDHISLCAHWIVLACIFFSTRFYEKSNSLKKLIIWSAMVCLSISIHPYFILFVLSFALFDMFGFVFIENLWNKKSFLYGSLGFLWVLGVAVMTAAALGLLDSSSQRAMNGGLHFYTADIFMFLNSGGLTHLTPALWDFSMGQYEAYSFLGLGMIVLTLIYGIDLGKHGGVFRNIRIITRTNRMYFPCLLAIALLTFFAVGSHVRFFGKWIIQLNFLYEPFYPLLSSFRANGRFIWALYYFLMIAVLLYQPRAPILKKWNPILLLLCFSIQLIDLLPLRPILPEGQLKTKKELVGDLDLSKFEHIDIVPPQTNDDVCNGYQKTRSYVDFGILAAINHLEINSSFRARIPNDWFKDQCRLAIYEIQNKELREKTLYVLEEQILSEISQVFLDKYCQLFKSYALCSIKISQ